MDLKFKNCELVLTFVLFSMIVLHTIKSNNAINFNFKHPKTVAFKTLYICNKAKGDIMRRKNIDRTLN